MPAYKWLICFMVGILPVMATGSLFAQQSVNDTIRLGATIENGVSYPMAFLPEFVETGLYINGEDRIRRDRLRRDIYIVYPYAITAAVILKGLNENLEKMDSRRERKQYIKLVNSR